MLARTKPTRRSTAVLISGALVLAACGSSDGTTSIDDTTRDDTTRDDATTTNGATESPSITTDPSGTSGEGSGPISVPRIESSPPDVTIEGLSIARSGILPDGAPEPLVPLDEIRSGGPPPDGIPPIEDPVFIRPQEVDFLDDNEPILAIEIDGDARAYPIQILMWHEIVNDTIADVPVTISYCPLCNSAVAYDRRVGDLVVDFGTSGMLYNSALVMYDRQTETLWSHFSAQGIVGELTGVELATMPVATVPWNVWRDTHPDGLVLSRDTGFTRDYGRNPYPGYDNVNNQPFLFEGEVDGRLTAMTRMVGVEIDGEAIAVPLVLLEQQAVVTTVLAGTDLVVFWAPGTSSALEGGMVSTGDDVGATGVFVPEIDGRTLTFAPGDQPGDFVDQETGSTWDLFGRAVDGELEGDRLERVEHLDTFWFAWGAFRPDTELISG